MDENNLYDDNFSEDYDYDFIRMTVPFQITSAILLSILILSAICGNTITIIAYITDKGLHTVYDFFIFNLAVSDLLIGCVSMPFYAVYTLKEFIWEFGDMFCKVWHVVDFTACLESILLILMLRFDRLCLVKYGPFYSSKVTKAKARLAILISWIVSFMLYGPAIIGWNYWVGYTTVEPLDCDVEFAYNFAFTTTAGIIEFIIPVVGLAVLNVFIYKHIKSRVGQESKLRCNTVHSPSSITKGNNNPTGEAADKATSSIAVNKEVTTSLEFTLDETHTENLDSNKTENEIITTSQYFHSISSETEEEKVSNTPDHKLTVQITPEESDGIQMFVNENGITDKNYRSKGNKDTLRTGTFCSSREIITIKEDLNDLTKQADPNDFEGTLNHMYRKKGNCIPSHGEQNEMLNVGRKQNRIKFATVSLRPSVCKGLTSIKNKISLKFKSNHAHSRIKRDSKAARFLAILVIVFLACWVPYTVTTIIVSFCGDKCVNTSAYECMNLLLWSKSAINPLLYAMNSSRYRFNFKKYIICWKNQVHPNDTETTYQTAV